MTGKRKLMSNKGWACFCLIPKRLLSTLRPQSSRQGTSRGFTETELLGAALASGLTLALASAGLETIHNVSRQGEIKGTRRIELSRAIAYIDNDIKEGRIVDKVISTEDPRCNTNITPNGQPCLRITMPDDPNHKIYYGLKDISGIGQSNPDYKWNKPAILHRREVKLNPVTGTYGGNAWVLVDGLAIEDENGADLNLTCPDNFDGPFGSGGFHFCLGSGANRTVQVYLYGYTGKGNNPIEMTMQSFARNN